LNPISVSRKNKSSSADSQFLGTLALRCKAKVNPTDQEGCVVTAGPPFSNFRQKVCEKIGPNNWRKKWRKKLAKKLTKKICEKNFWCSLLESAASFCKILIINLVFEKIANISLKMSKNRPYL
jgi:hypothetical protein